MKSFYLNSNLCTAGDRYLQSGAFFTQVYGNSGNSYITYAMLRIMGGVIGDVTAADHHSSLNAAAMDADECRRVNRDYTHIFLTLQDHIRADVPESFYENAVRTLERLTLPVVSYSLGANSLEGYDTELNTKLSAGCLRFLHMLSERCQSIGVRGDYTASVLEKLGIRNYSVTGCPSYFESGPSHSLKSTPWDPAKYVGATGMFSNRDNARLYFFLQDELLATKIRYFDDPIVGRDFAHVSSALLRKPEQLPYLNALVTAAIEGRAELFSDMENWRAALASRCNFAIGTRLHGGIMAINAGIPAIVTNGDARATESCALLGIPHRPEGIEHDISLQALYESIDMDKINGRYDGLYKNFEEWRRVNQLEKPAYLRKAAPAIEVMSTIKETTMEERCLRGFMVAQYAASSGKTAAPLEQPSMAILASELCSLMMENGTDPYREAKRRGVPEHRFNNLQAAAFRADSVRTGDETAFNDAPLLSGAEPGGISLGLTDNTHNSLYVRHMEGPVRIGTDTGSGMALCSDGFRPRLRISAKGGISVGGNDYSGAPGKLHFVDSANTTIGGELYVEHGELKYKSPGGHITKLGRA